MPFDETLSTENLVYSSSKMFERRRRIMEETRLLVAEHGHEGFNMRDLCRRAKVAPQTVYKAFESKERLVAIAIRQHFHVYSANQAYHYDASTIQGVIEHIAVSHESMRNVREYAKAITAIYFSQTADPDLRAAASYNLMGTIQPWVASLRRGRALRKGVTADDFTDAVVHLLFSTTFEWCLGNIDDDDFLFKKLERLLVYSAGATRGEAQKEINRYLGDLFGRRQLIKAIHRNVSFQNISHSA